MAKQRRATFQEVLLAVRRRLVACGFKAQQIAFLAQNATPDFIGDVSVYLRPRGLRALREPARGGGRYTKVCVRILDVIVKATVAEDASGNDEQFLTGAARSIFATEDRILDALEGEVVVDVDGNAITTTTLELVSDTDPNKSRAPATGEVSMAFEVQYQPVLTLPRLTT